jgi:pyruvate dehydrogenase E2 component (dihydrolipoamide acetyltransferase)
MLFEFKLPDLGEGIHEAEVLSIEIKAGEMVKEDQLILKVETDKAAVEITSPVSGKVQEIFVKAGEIVTVGTVMVSFETTSAPHGAAPQVAEAPAAQPAREPVAATADSGAARAPSNYVNELAGARPIPATPATRRLARELGVDLRLVPATGPAGRVMKEDVRSFAAKSLEPMVSDPLAQRRAAKQQSKEGAASGNGSPQSLSAKYGGGEGGHEGQAAPANLHAAPPVVLPDFSKYGKVERVLLRSIRRKTAEGMARSWSHIPHVTQFDEADLTALDAVRSKFDEQVKGAGGRLTFTVFVLKAVVSALQKYPQFNASLDEAKSELVFKHYYNIGVAVATERGLIVPVVRDVDRKGIVELAVELAEIAEKTRLGKIELEGLQGGSFTITNVGAIGGTGMVPMINHPESAILGMAKAAQKPIVRDGKIEIGLILPLALSFDHRIADGAEAAYFLRHIISRLEEPFSFLKLEA